MTMNIFVLGMDEPNEATLRALPDASSYRFHRLLTLDDRACVVEELATGNQVTVEGYNQGGDVVIYGVVDSITYPDTPSFLRYQYPSKLPDDVVARLTDISWRVFTQGG